MRSFLCIFLAVFIIIRPVLPVLEYAFNYKYISTQLCENITKPEMHCNGKCYLKKKLSKSYDEEKNNPVSNKVVDLSETFSISIDDYHAFYFKYSQFLSTEITFGEHPQFYAYSYSPNFFHPPVRIV